MTGRVLGVDHGDAHTGLAISDPLGITAQPKGVVEGPDLAGTAARVAELAREAGAVEIVVGLPVNMSGREGPRAKLARRFGAAVQELVAVPVRYWDERLTTVQAERVLRGRGARTRKENTDVISAQFMLQSYLDARSRGSAAADDAEGVEP